MAFTLITAARCASVILALEPLDLGNYLAGFPLVVEDSDSSVAAPGALARNPVGCAASELVPLAPRHLAYGASNGLKAADLPGFVSWPCAGTVPDSRRTGLLTRTRVSGSASVLDYSLDSCSLGSFGALGGLDHGGCLG